MKIASLFALLAIPFVAHAAPEKATIAELLKTGAKFDKKVVVVRGSVDHFTARANRKGTAFFLFKLRDGKQFVSIFGYGTVTPAPKDGDKVEVTGRFEVERKVGTRSYKNEIDASTDKKNEFGVKPLKK